MLHRPASSVRQAQVPVRISGCLPQSVGQVDCDGATLRLPMFRKNSPRSTMPRSPAALRKPSTWPCVTSPAFSNRVATPVVTARHDGLWCVCPTGPKASRTADCMTDSSVCSSATNSSVGAACRVGPCTGWNSRSWTSCCRSCCRDSCDNAARRKFRSMGGNIRQREPDFGRQPWRRRVRPAAQQNNTFPSVPPSVRVPNFQTCFVFQEFQKWNNARST